MLKMVSLCDNATPTSSFNWLTNLLQDLWIFLITQYLINDPPGCYREYFLFTLLVLCYQSNGPESNSLDMVWWPNLKIRVNDVKFRPLLKASSAPKIACKIASLIFLTNTLVLTPNNSSTLHTDVCGCQHSFIPRTFPFGHMWNWGLIHSHKNQWKKFSMVEISVSNSLHLLYVLRLYLVVPLKSISFSHMGNMY